MPTIPADLTIGIDNSTYALSDCVGTSEAAHLLGENVATVRRRVATGELPGVKVGKPPADPARDRRRIRIPLPAINALLQPASAQSEMAR